MNRLIDSPERSPCRKFDLEAINSELHSIRRDPSDSLSNVSFRTDPLNMGFIAEDDSSSHN